MLVPLKNVNKNFLSILLFLLNALFIFGTTHIFFTLEIGILVTCFLSIYFHRYGHINTALKWQRKHIAPSLNSQKTPLCGVFCENIGENWPCHSYTVYSSLRCIPSLTLAFTNSTSSQSVTVTRLLTVLCPFESFDQHPWNWLGYFQAGIPWSQNEKSMAANLGFSAFHLLIMLTVNPMSCTMLFTLWPCFSMFWYL